MRLLALNTRRQFSHVAIALRGIVEAGLLHCNTILLLLLPVLRLLTTPIKPIKTIKTTKIPTFLFSSPPSSIIPPVPSPVRSLCPPLPCPVLPSTAPPHLQLQYITALHSSVTPAKLQPPHHHAHLLRFAVCPSTRLTLTIAQEELSMVKAVLLIFGSGAAVR
ncbi:uncharacterized protein BKA78DRAFT_45916 [Phyllosticta capitalensis]|uniref:uncharacterized protein n=1 Tax=Phyllosticta capitalensis TaxID=121624 RepID=UPI00312D58C0